MKVLLIAIFPVCGLKAADCECGQPAGNKAPLKSVTGLKCPVDEKEGCGSGYCSGKVKRDIFVEHQGRVVHFCCEGCSEAFKKDPKAYLEQVKAQWKKVDESKKQQS